LEVKYGGHSINFTTSYKYLGYTLDSCLALSENLNIAYKKASNRVRLLSKLCVYVTPEAAFKIYEMMILPIITYSTSIKPTLTRTQLAKLTSIENRVNEIVGQEKHIPRLEKLIQKKACLTVRKCLDNDVCSII
jgi:hypothetical protein